MLKRCFFTGNVGGADGAVASIKCRHQALSGGRDGIARRVNVPEIKSSWVAFFEAAGAGAYC